MFVKQCHGPSEARFILSDDSRFVAQMDEGTDAEWSLLTAAPDLLAARKAFGRMDNGGRIPWVHNIAHQKDIEKLRAIGMAQADVWNNLAIPAIAKAEGHP